ncbi:Cupin 2 conserved barrel domain protein [Anaeromyxobacter sp. K]|uniref:cupin domain-containing protein n=1 Tax=Anaeromyxobacter sp. (strain K) TaxID=447217 RepID=UPI00015F9DB5|nr:cupin domain-containing protein [Anaeromyxobacter sp. K]ACG73630.1 Cupin 2 conserved barrel domain protein [Anaeromyxobacter sp. K]
MPDPGPSRVLVRAAQRGPAHTAGHPYNPRAEVHGWMLSRAAGLARVAVNLAWLEPGRESAVYHLHHREEEWVYVLEGQGVLELDGADHPVGPGDFAAFPPGVAHQVRNASADARLWVLEGGEVIGDVEVADFPKLGRRLVRTGTRHAVYPLDAEVPFLPAGTEPPREPSGLPPPGAPPRLLVRAGDRGEARPYSHPQNARSEVRLQWLSRPALRRISAGIAAVPAGRESFVRHVHRHDEEWMYVLSGRGVALLGDREEPIGPGDFLGFPPGGEPHNVRAAPDAELVYLQGGDAWSRETIEIVDMPELGLRKTFVGTRSAMTFPLDAALEGKT